MSKGKRTRNAILEAGMAEASTNGLEGISIGGLAKRVGLSKSGLFAHFDSKEDLQMQVLESAVDLFVETVVSPAVKKPRGEPRVRALFDGWLAWSESSLLPGGCLFIATANELDDRPGPLRDFLVEKQRDWLDGLATAARLAVEEGHFRADLDVNQFAYQFYAIILAGHHFDRLLHDPKTYDRCRAAFEILIDRSRVTN